MISIYNFTKLNSLLQDFYNITKIRITVFDDVFQEIAAYPKNIADFCNIVRSDEVGLKKCQNCDENACSTAKVSKRLYIYRCHAGLTESILPITVSNIVIGYLFFGQVFSYNLYSEGITQILKDCQNLKIDFHKLKKSLNSQPLIDEDYIISASHIMETVASYLCIERMVALKQENIIVKIDDYIHDNFAKDIDVMDIVSTFEIGKTQLYEISKENYGVGIATYIRNLRISKAKELLVEHNELSLKEIATQCGFNDYNYFITVFKREVGLTPKEFSRINSITQNSRT